MTKTQADEALDELRLLMQEIKDLINAPRGRDETVIDRIMSMSVRALNAANEFKTLDEWITKGGSLPRDWSGK
jgi:hypothetical protein